MVKSEHGWLALPLITCRNAKLFPDDAWEIQKLCPIISICIIMVDHLFPLFSLYMSKNTASISITFYQVQYPYSNGTCPRSLLYHLFEAPVLGPWAHLGFEKSAPNALVENQPRHEVWIAMAWTTKHISQKTIKARVANHNGMDAKRLRAHEKLLKRERQITNNGSGAKLLIKNAPQNWRKEGHTIPFILWSNFLVVLWLSQYEFRNYL